MITTTCYLCALPRRVWEPDSESASGAASIHTFVQDALGIERRIMRGVNQENERMRYNLCCSGIEAAIAPQLLVQTETAAEFQSVLASGRLPVSSLRAGYIEILAEIIARWPDGAAEHRVAAGFYPPAEIDTQNTAFYALAQQAGQADHEDVRRRTAFFERARRADCGVVVLQDPF